MECFKKCPKCGRYMTPHLRYVYGQAFTIYSCFCGYSEDTFGVRYDNKQVIREVERVTERLSNKNPCNSCGADRQIGNPNRWECECDRCSKPYEWKNDCIKKLAEYETAEEEGRLVILPKCNIGDTVYLPIDFQNKIYTGTVDGFEYSPRRNKWVVKIITDDGEKCYEAFDDFGKTFFLDIEDAAKALKEMEGK